MRLSGSFEWHGQGTEAERATDLISFGALVYVCVGPSENIASASSRLEVVVERASACEMGEQVPALGRLPGDFQTVQAPHSQTAYLI